MIMTNTNLDEKLIKEIEAMIERRMLNTGESRSQACDHIRRYITKRFV